MMKINHRPAVTKFHCAASKWRYPVGICSASIHATHPALRGWSLCFCAGALRGGARRPGLLLHSAATDETRWTDRKTLLFLINPTGPLWFTLTFIYKSSLTKTAFSCPNSPTHHCRYQRQPLALACWLPPPSCLCHVWPTSVCTTL